jgi:hypothetical protein
VKGDVPIPAVERAEGIRITYRVRGAIAG